MIRPKVHLASLAVGLALGGVSGAGAMLVAFPFLFPPPAAADRPIEGVAGAFGPQRTFRFDDTAPGRDPIHWADGSGRLVRTDQGWVLRLEADFRAGPGPNFWIYLNTRPVGEEGDFRSDAQRVRLAQLRSFQGAQNYLLPAGFDPGRFSTVTIWCETFGVYIASGVLQPPAASGGAPGQAPT